MQKSLLLIALFFSFILSKGQTFTGAGGTIPGSSATQKCFPITVAGIGPINQTTIGFASVCLSITHPNVDELEILLKAPDGTLVPLSIQNGGTGNNYTNTCFTATAATSIKFGSAPFTGTYSPEGYLGSVNNGQNANGIWSICIQDRRNTGNAGSLNNNWSLTFNNTPAPLPQSLPACSTTLPATSSCATATAICDFNGLCGSTTGSSVQDWASSGLDGCFGLQNNSFIKFTASASTASFTVWVPTNTGGTGGGIQMLFFSGTCNSGPVTTHGCYPHIFPYQSPSQPLPTVISATGLTPGNTYYLMTDGFNNDNCTFRIAANAGVNILNINPTAAAICNGQNVNLTATGGNGTYSWSPASTLSSNSGATVTATPASTATYTVSSLTSGGCPLTKDVTVVVNDTPVVTTQPSTSTQNICLNGIVTPLSVVANAGSGTITGYQWYISLTPTNTGGFLLPFATSSTYTPSSSSIGTLYFYCRVTNSNGCSTKSAISGPVIVINTVTTPTASVIAQPTCFVPTSSIVVTAPVGANIQYSIGGAYQAGGTFTGLTPATYSVTAKNIVTGCISAIRTVTINPLPAPPLAPTVAVTAQPTCAIPTATINITAPLGGNFIYSVGSIFQASTIFAGLLNNTTYSVSLKDTLTGCISASTQVTPNSLPAGPALPVAAVTVQPSCLIPTASIAISAPLGANIEYSIGGTYQASNLFSGIINGTSINITAKDIITGCVSAALVLPINTIPGAPATPTASITSQPTCAVPTGTITISAPSGVVYQFSTGGAYQANNVFTGLIPGNSYLVTTKDTSTGCVSAPVAVTIDAIPVIPAPTVTTPVAYCLNSAAGALTASGTGLLWYNAAVGGIGSATAPTPVTTGPGSTIYYVSQTIATCEGPRAAITVTINSTPAPTVTTPVAYCLNGTAAALTASGTGLLWYNAAVGGVGSSTAPTPVTTGPGSTIYYVSQTIATCEGPRAAITVTINSTPAPTVTTPVAYCLNGTAAALTASGTGLLWYNTAVGGVGSVTAPTPVTTGPGSTIYYVSQTIATCEGPRAAITVTINSTPAPTVTTPVTYCQNLPATALGAIGSNLLWYIVSAGGTGVATAPIPSTASAGSFQYYVSQTSLGCEGPREIINVTVHPTPVLPIVTTPVTYCQNLPATALIASGSNLLWYSVSAGGTGVATAPIPSTASAGSFQYFVSQTLLGCEGPREIINVTIHPTPVLPTVTTPVFYCQNNTAAPLNAIGTTLLWYSTLVGGTASSLTPIPVTTVTGNTFYYVSQTSSFGCESPRAAITVTISPTVNAVTTFNYNPNVVCKNGINPGPTYAIGFTSGGIFTSTPGLSVNAVNGNIDLPSSQPGNYTINYTYNAQGCTLAGSSTTSILINPAIATNTIFSYSSPICKSDQNPSPAFASGFTLGGQFASTTGLSVDASTGLVNLALTIPGIYQVTYTLPTLGCRQGTSNFSFISITANTLPVTSFSYSPAAVCPGEANPVINKVTGFTTGGSYKAMPAGLSLNAATGAIDVAASSIGIYTITYITPALGCRFADSSRFTFIIRSATPPNTSFFYATPVCKSDPVTLPLFGTNFTAGGQFSAVAGLSINSSNGNVNVVQSTAGVYVVKYKLLASACSLADSGTATIEIVNLPDNPVISSPPVCGPGTTTITAISNGSILWYSDAATSNLINSGNSFATSLNANIRYYLTATIGNCTTAAIPADIIINPKPAAPNIGNDTSICNGDRLLLNPGVYNSYLWQDGTTLPTLSVNRSDTYSVIVTNAAGCTKTDSITVNLLANCDDIQFANAFSPNGDGLNEKFGPGGNLFLVQNYSFSIFNRYGELVFKSDNPYQKWDGTYKGKSYGNNSFVWVATYIYRGKIKKTQKGNVSLLR